MKRSFWVATIIIIIALAAAYFFLRPTPVILQKTQDFLLTTCLEQSESYRAFAHAVNTNDVSACEQVTSIVQKPLCIAAVTRDSVKCARAEKDLQEYCQALAAGQHLCSKGLLRFACEAAAQGDTAYFDSGEAEEDCAAAVTLEVVLESRDKRNCAQITHLVLRKECEQTLS